MTPSLAALAGPVPPVVRPEPPVFKVTEYLTKAGVGLGKVMVTTGSVTKPFGQLVEEVSRQYSIHPAYILTMLQAEQSLLSSSEVPDIGLKVVALPVPGPANLPRNRAMPDDSDRQTVAAQYAKGHNQWILRNGGDYTTDKAWYLLLTGNRRMAYALGTGIPDPKIFPPWDARKYLGLANQIREAARLLDGYLKKYENARIEGTLDQLLIPVYEGGLVRPADATTFALLQYTPSLNGLVERPKIFAGIMNKARGWGLAA
jgi:hypothetical protein